MTGPPAPSADRDGFDQLAAAATRVLRAALQGAASLRATEDRAEALLRELERTVASVLREAQAAADELRAGALDGGRGAAGHADGDSPLDSGERVVLRDASPPRRDGPDDIVIRKSRRGRA